MDPMVGLGLGAVVLVAIALLAVWSASGGRARQQPPRESAVPAGSETNIMPETDAARTETERAEAAREDLLMAADSFDDRFTAATGDLSAAGVAEAVEEMREERDESWNETETSASEAPREAPAVKALEPPSPSPLAALPPGPRSRISSGIPLALGATAAAAGVGAVWAFVRWRQERNRPVNRLRRRVSRVARDVSERLPDRDELVTRLPDREVAAPAGGTGMLLLAGSLLAWRLLRGRGQSDDLAERTSGAAAAALESGAAQEVRTRLGRIWLPGSGPAEAVTTTARAAMKAVDERAPEMQAGDRGPARALVGVGVAAAGGYLLWRALRGQSGESYVPASDEV